MRKLEVRNTDALHSTLKLECSRMPSFRFLHRIHCVLLVGKGHSCYHVAGWFCEDPRTVERWVHNFNVFGIEGLKDEPVGRPSKIRGDQLNRLQIDVSEDPSSMGYNQDYWDGRLLRIHLEQLYGVVLSVRQCQRLLHQFQHDSISHIGSPQ